MFGRRLPLPGLLGSAPVLDRRERRGGGEREREGKERRWGRAFSSFIPFGEIEKGTRGRKRERKEKKRKAVGFGRVFSNIRIQRKSK